MWTGTPLPLIPRSHSRMTGRQSSTSTRRFIASVPTSPSRAVSSLKNSVVQQREEREPTLQCKLDYYENYRHMGRAKELRKMRHKSEAHLAYLECVEREKLSPTPVGILPKSKALESTINVQFAFIGDRLAHALSEGMRHSPVSEVNLRGNRLSSQSSSRIIKRLSPTAIKSLDMSGNKLGPSGVSRLLSVLELGGLTVLRLEDCQLSTEELQHLLASASPSKTLRELSLARNNLGEAAGKLLGSFLMYSSLKVLDLHWNCIRASGATLLFQGLKENSTLEELDLSWNVLDSHDTYGLTAAMSNALELDDHLRHLDLSFNYLSSAQCETISKGLSENHTLLGLHIIGNHCSIDAHGFLHPQELCKTEEANYFRRILRGRKPKGQKCWLCENWVETEVCYQGLAAPPVFVHLEIDGFEPELLEQHKGMQVLRRMLPSGVQRLFFSSGGSAVLSGAYTHTHMQEPLTQTVKFYEGCTQTVTVEAMQTIAVQGRACSQSEKLEVLPRTFHSYSPSEIAKDREPWSLPISLFHPYRFDTESLTADCFEFDWTSSRLPKLIKDPVQNAAVKEHLRAAYRHMCVPRRREMYKYYSSLDQGTVPAVGSNSFTEIVIKSNLIGGGFGLADLDLVFKNTLFSEVKNNPLVPGGALVRFQFLEMIARVALDKYLRTKVVSTPAEAVERLLTEMKPRLEEYDSNVWRWGVYICEEVDVVYKAYKPVLDAVYQRFSVRKSKPGQPKFMSQEEFTDLCIQAGLVSDALVARDVGGCFGLAQMTEVDEITATKHMEMSFVEFLEALARACDKANIQKDGKVPNSLAGKIEAAMPQLLKLTPRALQETFRPPRLPIAID